MTASKTPLLKLEDIAEWWDCSKRARETDGSIRATLPVLQRGFVWKPAQIERLWDSVVQGFPIGSMLLQPLSASSEEKSEPMKGQNEKTKNPTHFLLDGQQRATSIALGFNNIWTKNKNDIWAALWVDLVPLENNERRFAFRVLTKSHPWGYGRTDSSKKLTAENMRKALESFRYLAEDTSLKSKDLSIQKIFPWDAKAPIPLALLLEGINKNKGSDEDIASDLLKFMKKCPFWKEESPYPFPLVRSILSEKEEEIESIVKGRKGFKDLVKALREALSKDSIPVLIFTPPTGQNDKDKGGNDSVFNLFQRVNTAGTMPTNEDINYSLLKSIAPELVKSIEALSKEKTMASPARMVSLIVRLHIMVNSKKKNEKNVALPSVLKTADFRRRVQEKDFCKELGMFCKEKGGDILKKVWELLTDSDDALPPYLAAGISQKADDMMLLLMYWMHGLPDKEWGAVDKKVTLGFIVSVSWFLKAPEIKRCARALVEKLEKSDKNFFNHERFRALIDEKSMMIPLPSPNDLDTIFKKQVLEKEEYKNNILTEKEGWKVFYGDVFYKSEKIDKDKWWQFFSKIFHDRNFLLYAQRGFIKAEFGEYDPTQTDQINDLNRPWDYDHILPYSWSHDGKGCYSGLPKLVRYCVNSNGNFRAWPMELNRSKKDKEIIEKKIAGYTNLKDYDKVCNASFINKEKEKWNELEGKKDDFRNEGSHWNIFIGLSINRTRAIYEEFYNNLKIEELMKTGNTGR